ncbi:MAG: FAD-binding oxidoreductase [Candidatus Thorarchaeota archaeon]|nr:FAD-binding oxidoreductase [Candidatus Thorarchaeota archaeon]
MKIRDVVAGANASIYYRMNFKLIKGVFYPRTENDVIEAIRLAQEHGFDVTPKGGGSGLSGACTGGNRERIILSSLQMKEVLGFSKDQGYVDVQAGTTPDEINAVLQPSGLRFWVAPSSRDVATVGGILSTDGGGNDAWINGTMRDNTLRVKMVLYDGRLIVVDHKGVRSPDKELEAQLNSAGMTLNDVAGSHGTLGFITELRLVVRPAKTQKLVGGVSHFADCSEMGKAIDRMVRANSPIVYGEAITSVHEDIRGELTPPLLILEFPEAYEHEIAGMSQYTRYDPTALKAMKDIRLKLPKRNPVRGRQLALFEDYGFYGESLVHMQERIDEIDNLLRKHEF